MGSEGTDATTGAPWSGIELLDNAIEVLAAERIDDLPPDVLGERLTRLRKAIDRLECECTRALARFDSRGGFIASGAVDTVAWLRNECRLSFGAAAERVNLARGLAHLPETAEAFARGKIGYQHAAVIAYSAAEVGPNALAQLEEVAVDAAHQMDPGRLRQLTKQFRAVVDREGFLADADAAYARRRMRLGHSLDGLFSFDGLLDVEGGSYLRTALDAIMGRPADGDERTPAQRRADALVELAKRQMEGTAGLPESGGQRPHLAVVAPLATLRQDAAAPAGELQWEFPVPAETVRRLSCDASMTPIVVGDDGDPLHVGRATRTVPAALRRALAVRDKHCRFPGCDRPVAWCEGHHIRHWADGGETTKDNAALLCGHHHRLVHEGGWQVVWDDLGELVAIPP